MDIVKLIEQLNDFNENHIAVLCGSGQCACGYLCDKDDCIVVRAATAISTLRAENEKLRAELEQVKQCVDGKPAADVAPVRHGRWMTTDAYPHHLYCSVCYKTYAKNAKWVNELDLPTNYCPNCGALMEKKEDEHD